MSRCLSGHNLANLRNTGRDVYSLLWRAKALKYSAGRAPTKRRQYRITTQRIGLIQEPEQRFRKRGEAQVRAATDGEQIAGRRPLRNRCGIGTDYRYPSPGLPG